MNPNDTVEDEQLKNPGGDKLTMIFAIQRKLQERLNPEMFDWIAPMPGETWSGTAHLDVCMDMVEQHSKCMMHEAVELMDWTPWKHWSQSLGNKVDKQKPEGYIGSDEHLNEMRMEVVDQLHFLVNEALQLNMSAEDLFVMYLDKNKINHDRKESGTY